MSPSPHLRRLALAACVLLLGTASAQAAVPFPAQAVSTPLIAENGQTIGSLSVWNDTRTLHATYITRDGWQLQRTNLHLANTIDGFPTNGKGGTPRFKDFEFSHVHDPLRTEHELIKTYPTDLPVATGKLIAARAEVVRTVNGVQEATVAWADGPLKFKNPATIYSYAVQPMLSFPILNGAINFTAYFSARPANFMGYWKIQVNSAPAGSSIIAGNSYPAWCCERFVYMNDGSTHNGIPLDSLLNPIPSVQPNRFTNAAWDNVNWLINHKPATATREEIQNAIWSLLGQGTEPGFASNQQVLNMVAAANANGNGFIPGDGEIMGIIIEVPGTQGFYLELQVELIWPDPDDNG